VGAIVSADLTEIQRPAQPVTDTRGIERISLVPSGHDTEYFADRGLPPGGDITDDTFGDKTRQVEVAADASETSAEADEEAAHTRNVPEIAEYLGPVITVGEIADSNNRGPTRRIEATKSAEEADPVESPEPEQTAQEARVSAEPLAPSAEADAAGSSNGNGHQHPPEDSPTFDDGDPDRADDEGGYTEETPGDEPPSLNSLALEIQTLQYEKLPDLMAQLGDDSDAVKQARAELEAKTNELTRRYFKAENDKQTGTATNEDLENEPPASSIDRNEIDKENIQPLEWPNRYAPLAVVKERPLAVAPGKTLRWGAINELYDPLTAPTLAVDTQVFARAMDIVKIDSLTVGLVHEIISGDNWGAPYSFRYYSPTDTGPDSRAEIVVDQRYLKYRAAKWAQYQNEVKLREINAGDPRSYALALNESVGICLGNLAARSSDSTNAISLRQGFRELITGVRTATYRMGRAGLFVVRPTDELHKEEP
jgi:hypothetical protein